MTASRSALHAAYEDKIKAQLQRVRNGQKLEGPLLICDPAAITFPVTTQDIDSG